MTEQQRIEAAVAEAIAFRLNPVQWIGSDGTKSFNISDMDSAHIVNCLRMIASGRMKRTMTNGIHKTKWAEIFKNELIARKFKAGNNDGY